MYKLSLKNVSASTLDYTNSVSIGVGETYELYNINGDIETKNNFLMIYRNGLRSILTDIQNEDIEIYKDNVLVSDNTTAFGYLEIVDKEYRESIFTNKSKKGIPLITQTDKEIDWQAAKQYFNHYGYHIDFVIPNVSVDFSNLNTYTEEGDVYTPGYNQYILTIVQEKGVKWFCTLDYDINPDDLEDFEKNYRTMCGNTKHFEKGLVYDFTPTENVRYYKVPNNKRNYLHTISMKLKSGTPVENEDDFDKVQIELVGQTDVDTYMTLATLCEDGVLPDNLDEVESNSARGWYNIPYEFMTMPTYIKTTLTRATGSTDTLKIKMRLKFEIKE